jgi:DNA (cytosine-5)-methyltransferase 1
MRYLSVCSGIEAVSVAWQPLGWRPAMFAEIDPFCAWLLHSRHGATRPMHMPSPNDAATRKEAKQRAAAIRNVIALPADGAVINAGDFTHIGADDVGTIDLLAGGTPCQSFSVAGKRAGLDDPRGNLTIEFARLAGRLRPLWVVWENVPGVLSIDGGRTFGAFLGMLVELGYGIAYRVLDAQYFGVPQRRRRVFVVGHLGGWRGPSAVLFERHSLSGYPPPRRKTRQDIAGAFGAGAAKDGMARNAYASRLHASTGDTAHCLNAGGMGRQDFETETLIAHTVYTEGFDADDGADRGDPLMPIAICTAHSGSNGSGFSEAIAHTLLSSGNQAVALSTNQRGELRERPVHGSLTASRSGKQFDAVMQEMAVRRLTPRECERLQGFPDDYTLVEYRGKPASDGPRYKALGNSMAVPVMRWIGERIAAVDAIPEDLESHAR